MTTKTRFFDGGVVWTVREKKRNPGGQPMFRREERPSQQGYIIVNGVRFTWQRNGAVVTVNNSLYGRTKHAVGVGRAQTDLVRHLALELLCRGPRKASELFPAMTSGITDRFES